MPDDTMGFLIRVRSVRSDRLLNRRRREFFTVMVFSNGVPSGPLIK